MVKVLVREAEPCEACGDTYLSLYPLRICKDHEGLERIDRVIEKPVKEGMICKACYEAAYLKNSIIPLTQRNGVIESIIRVFANELVEHNLNFHCTCPPREGVENE